MKRNSNLMLGLLTGIIDTFLKYQYYNIEIFDFTTLFGILSNHEYFNGIKGHPLSLFPLSLSLAPSAASNRVPLRLVFLCLSVLFLVVNLTCALLIQSAEQRADPAR